MHSPEIATRAGRFVVHQHAATRMHYDLRIEIAGTLQSFAVPKGPSLSTTDKRLAVHTEDHPLEYLEFEAVIPEGNYGAGPMIAWDTGIIHYLENTAEQGLASGKIDFVLAGFKLRGRFALIETKGRDPGPLLTSKATNKHWLLVKKADAHASEQRDVIAEEPESVLSGLRVDELPEIASHAADVVQLARQLGAAKRSVKLDEIVPMRCAENGGRLNDPESLYELKLDGVRILAERHGEHVQLRYRTQRNATPNFPELVRALRAIPASRVILDGEIIAYDARGLPSFQRLAERIHKQEPRAIVQAARSIPAQFVAFDILALDDLDLRKLPLRARKQVLARLLRGKGFVRQLEYVEGDGEILFEFCEAHDLEGLIAKRADSQYAQGNQRSGHWCKLKRSHSDDFVVTGWVEGKGKRSGFGSLEIGSYVDGQLISRGRVGSGLDDRSIDDLERLLAPLIVPKNLAKGEPLPTSGKRTFVKPQVVISVSHMGFSEEGRLRHPVYRGLREDVAATDCVAAPEQEREAAIPEPAVGGAEQFKSARVNLTNQKKVFWPAEGITKGDLVEYYGAIAATLLPYLQDRPVLMVRYPDGIEGKNFYQWNIPQGTPSWVRTEIIHSDEHRRDVTFFRVEDRDTLLYIANLGCIPLHILAGRFRDLESCDFLTIDFDLGEAPFGHAVTLARELHDVLDALELPSFPKTSGQTGLHVLVPMGGAPFAAATALANLLGRIVHERHPQLSTIERMRKNRPNAVYIDTGQTGRSRAIVSPYSVRAYPGARVSTPLTWDEVSAALVPARHTLLTVPERVAVRGDPMAELLKVKPDLERATQRLAQLLEESKSRKRA